MPEKPTFVHPHVALSFDYEYFVSGIDGLVQRETSRERDERNDVDEGEPNDRNRRITKVRNAPENIRSVNAGSGHCIVTDYSLRCFSMGSNEYGQLGLGDLANRPFLTPIPRGTFNDLPILKLGCGERFTIALDIEGGVWCFGNLGVMTPWMRDKDENFTKPIQIPHIPRMKDVCCECEHFTTLTNEGSLWVSAMKKGEKTEESRKLIRELQSSGRVTTESLNLIGCLIECTYGDVPYTKFTQITSSYETTWALDDNGRVWKFDGTSLNLESRIPPVFKGGERWYHIPQIDKEIPLAKSIHALTSVLFVETLSGDRDDIWILDWNDENATTSKKFLLSEPWQLHPPRNQRLPTSLPSGMGGDEDLFPWVDEEGYCWDCSRTTWEKTKIMGPDGQQQIQIALNPSRFQRMKNARMFIPPKRRMYPNGPY